MLVDFSGFETAFPVWQERVPFDWNKPKQKWFNEPMWSHIDTDFWRFSHVGQSIHGRFNHTCFLFSPKLPKELVPTSEKKKTWCREIVYVFSHPKSPWLPYLQISQRGIYATGWPSPFWVTVPVSWKSFWKLFGSKPWKVEEGNQVSWGR